jgi:hypothetical protein
MIDDRTCNLHHHPYRDLPELECHIAPPYAIINAGPKCVGLDIDKLALDYHESEACESQRALKAELELLRDTWALFEDAGDAAKAWEEKEREEKRKRKCDDDSMDTASRTTRRTRRSQYSANNGEGTQPSPSRPGSRASRQRSAGSNTGKQPTQPSNTRKRKYGSSSSGVTLTEAAVSCFYKRQKMGDLNATVKRWVESTYS